MQRRSHENFNLFLSLKCCLVFILHLVFAEAVSSSLPVGDPLPPSGSSPPTSESPSGSSGTELPKSGDQVGNIEQALKDAGTHTHGN